MVSTSQLCRTMPSTSSLTKSHHHRGILSVLDSDHNNNTMKVANSSLRRTLSADMSSLTWREQSGFPVIDSLSSYVSEDEEGEKANNRRPSSWFSLLNPKTEADPPPYIHPLVKRSASAASLKSLESCTESLGSESGSDGFTFSSLPNTNKQITKKEETENEEERTHNNHPHQGATTSDVEKMMQFTRKKRHPRPFPPPLPSLSYHQDGQPLHVRSHRNLGRLVLEATAVPLQTKNFQAQREDGRLLLAFTHHTNTDQPDKEEEIGDRKEVEKERGEKEEEEEKTRVLKSCKDPQTSIFSWERTDDILVSL